MTLLFIDITGATSLVEEDDIIGVPTDIGKFKS